MFRQCPSPRKRRKDGCNSSHNTLLHGAERVFPAKPSTNNNIDISKSNAGTGRLSTGLQQLRKTTTLSSVTDVKDLLQVTELKLTNSSDTSTTALVLCDTACSNSWVSDSLAARLGLQGTALKLTVKGINTEELIDTKVVQLTVTPHKDQDFEAFTVRPYVRETLNVGSDIIDVKSMLETYPHLAVLDPVRYSYGEIEMTWTGCLPCHPPVRVFFSRRKALTVCCPLAHWLGFKWPTPVKFKFGLGVFQSQYRTRF